jgi:hypothetical protein
MQLMPVDLQLGQLLFFSKSSTYTNIKPAAQAQVTIQKLESVAVKRPLSEQFIVVQ